MKRFVTLLLACLLLLVACEKNEESGVQTTTPPETYPVTTEAESKEPAETTGKAPGTYEVIDPDFSQFPR